MKCKYFVIMICLALSPAIALAQSQVEDDIYLIINEAEGFNIALATLDAQEAWGRLTAEPGTYVSAIDALMVFPDNSNLADYPEVINSYNAGALLGFLISLGVQDIGTPEVLSTLLRLNVDLAEDIDLMQDELANNPPVDPTDLRQALTTAEYLYIKTLQVAELMDDTVLMVNVLAQHGTKGQYVQSFIEGYSEVVAGAYPPTQTLSVTDDWEMVGLPVALFNPDFQSVFSDPELAQEPFWWDGQQYQLQETLVFGRGYWVKAVETGTETVTGSIETLVTLDLLEGWNMVSGPSCDLDISLIDDPAGIAVLDNVFRTVGSNYVIATTIEQGLGYWIKANVAGQILMDCEANSSSKTRQALAIFDPDESGFQTLNIRGANGREQALYVGGELTDDAPSSFELPPRNPFSTFDARFANNSRLFEGDQPAVITLSSDSYPVTLDLSGEVVNYSFIVEEIEGGEAVSRQLLSPGDVFTISNEEVSSIRIQRQ